MRKNGYDSLNKPFTLSAYAYEGKNTAMGANFSASRAIVSAVSGDDLSRCLYRVSTRVSIATS